MRKLFLSASLLLCGVVAMSAQEEKSEEYIFTTVDSVAITSIKNQNQTGTCWSFSTISFLESELLRMGKGEYDLSEMFVVHKTMEDRATAAVRTHGDVSYAPGGSFYDVLYCYKHYGMVPNTVMPGILYDSEKHDHNELSNVAGAYVNAIAKGNARRLTNVWHNGLSAIYDAYIGECPERFLYEGKEYTPREYADNLLGLNMDDYVSLTSFTHHPFYEQFIIEVPDNWRWAESYNLPIEELMEVMKYSIKSGYSFAWASDVSESGFGRRQGVAVVPAEGVSVEDALSHPTEEREITQEMRQKGYDNWETTDDHGMHIFGIATDQNGKEYFMVKNSWSEDSGRRGIWYASEAFVAYKTMNIVLHKSAIPKHIKKSLGLK